MLIEQSQDKPLKQANCVVNDVNFLVDKYNEVEIKH